MNSTTAVNHFYSVRSIFNAISILQLTDDWWPKPACVKDGGTYDIIIVGGGTAGCVVASRLAEIKKLSILLIEAGGKPSFEAGYPGYFPYLRDTAVDWNITSTKTYIMQYHKNSVAGIAQGKMLGGTSSLSYMNYVRGNPRNYDDWANFTKDASWSFEAVLPIFKRSEKVVDKKILSSPADRALHGTKGPLTLRKYYFDIVDEYISAYEEMGTKSVIDINLRNPLGVTNMLFMNNKKHRQSTAYSFLRPKKHYTNLNVMTNAFVTKINFDDNKRAVGVEIRTKSNKIITVKAKKEIIISAGVFKTPQLLMLSGIGPRKHLLSKKIKVIADLPVGNNFQDHPLCVTAFRMGKRNPSGPLNPYVFGVPVLDAYIAINNKSQNYPDYEIIGLIVDDPELFLIFCEFTFTFKTKICDTIVRGLKDKQLFLVFNLLASPKSRGKIRLNTLNVEDQPLADPGYYANEQDLEKHAEAQIHFNSILKSRYFKSVNAELIDPKLEMCDELDKQSKEYWKCHCSRLITPALFFVGTCPMGTVLDSKLLVKGVHKLRIVDASVMPTSITSPTIAAIVMIAQKASDMIIKAHSLK